MKFDLKNIACIGRTLDEYSRMFDLRFTEVEYTRILDAGGGVSSFTAEASESGIGAISADIIYGTPPDMLEKKCKYDLDEVIGKLPAVQNGYVWDFYKDPQGLMGYREAAYERFMEDYRRHGASRYVHAGFPLTPFTDNEFDLTLVSHLLFLYDEHLDYNFHLDTLTELARVTREEIRIFPLVNLRYKRSEFVERLMKEPVFDRWKFEIRKVDYEFVRGGNEYLSLRK